MPGTFSEAGRLQVLVGYFEKTCWWWKLSFAESAPAQSLLRAYRSVGLCYAPGSDSYQLFAIKDNSVHYMSDWGLASIYYLIFIFYFFFIAKPIVPFWKLGNLAL